jgi:hypothetical protein
MPAEYDLEWGFDTTLDLYALMVVIYRVLRKYMNPNRRFFLAFWPIQLRNLCKEQ